MMDSNDSGSSVLHINGISGTGGNAGILESFIVYTVTTGSSNPPPSILLIQLDKLKNTITAFKGKIDLCVLETWSKFPPNTGKSLTFLAEQITKSLGLQPGDQLLRIEPLANGAILSIHESPSIEAIGKLNMQQIPATEGILSLISSCMEMTARCSNTLSDPKTSELQKQIKSLEDLIAKFTVEKHQEEDRIFRAVKLYVDAKKDRIKELERQLNHEVPEFSNPASDTDVEESEPENEVQISGNDNDSRLSGAEQMDVEETIQNTSPQGLDINDDEDEEVFNPRRVVKKSKKPVIKDSSDSDTDFDEDAA